MKKSIFRKLFYTVTSLFAITAGMISCNNFSGLNNDFQVTADKAKVSFSIDDSGRYVSFDTSTANIFFEITCTSENGEKITIPLHQTETIELDYGRWKFELDGYQYNYDLSSSNLQKLFDFLNNLSGENQQAGNQQAGNQNDTREDYGMIPERNSGESVSEGNISGESVSEGSSGEDFEIPSLYTRGNKIFHSEINDYLLVASQNPYHIFFKLEPVSYDDDVQGNLSYYIGINNPYKYDYSLKVSYAIFDDYYTGKELIQVNSEQIENITQSLETFFDIDIQNNTVYKINLTLPQGFYYLDFNLEYSYENAEGEIVTLSKQTGETFSITSGFTADNFISEGKLIDLEGIFSIKYDLMNKDADFAENAVIPSTFSKFTNYQLPIPVLDGYTFTGWYSYDNPENIFFDLEGSKFDSDLTLCATWEKIKWNVPFGVNKWGENGEYNYCIGVNFTDSDNLKEFNKLFKEDDKVSITLRGIPDATADVYMDCTLATQKVDFSDWSQIGTATELIKLEEGVPFEQTFNIIMDVDAKDDPDYFEGICFFYYTNDYDEIITLNDFSFSVDLEPTFETVEYSYTIGSLTTTKQYFKSKESTLLTSNNIYSRFDWPTSDYILMGWYDNPDFEGEPVEKISAEENTISRNFWAKTQVRLSYNHYGENYSREILILDKLPEITTPYTAGQDLIIKVKGKTDKAFSGNLQLLLIDTTNNGWEMIADLVECYLDTPADTDFEIVYPITLTSDMPALADTRFHFQYNPSYLDEDLTFTQFDCELMDEYKPTSAKTKHVILKTCEGGIQVTLKRFEGETWKPSILFEDLNSGLQYDIAQEEMAQIDELSFIWPFCEKDKVYNFQFSCNQENGPWIGETLTCTAGGGIGEIDLSEFYKMSAHVENKEDGPYLTIDNFSNDKIKGIFNDISSKIPDIENQKFFLDFFSGTKDWQDTEWVYNSEQQMSESQSYNQFYVDLCRNGSFNILADYSDGWQTAYEINAKLSKHTYFWVTIDLQFKITGDNFAQGSFRVKGIETPETVYTPYDILPDISTEVKISFIYPEIRNPSFELTATGKDDKYTITADYNSEEITPLSFYWFVDDSLQSVTKNMFAPDFAILNAGYHTIKCLLLDESGEYLESQITLSINK